MTFVRFTRPMALLLAISAACAADPALPMSAAAPAGVTEPAELASLRQKAERGNAIAQYNLGLAYAQGRSVPVDPAEAFAWLTLAGEGGSTGRALEAVLGAMSAQQLSEGRQRLDALRATHSVLRIRPTSTRSPSSLGPAQPGATSTSATLASDATPAPSTEPIESGPAASARATSTQPPEKPGPSVTVAAAPVQPTPLPVVPRISAEESARRNNVTFTELAGLRAQLAEAHSNLTKQSRDLAVARADAESARIELTRQQAQLTATRNELSARTGVAAAAEQRAATLELDVAAARRAAAERDQQLATTTVGLNQRLSAVQQQLEASVTEQERLASALKEAVAARERLTAEMATLAESHAREVAALRAEIKRGAAAVAEATTHRRKEEDTLQARTREVEELRRNLAAVQLKLASTLAENSTRAEAADEITGALEARTREVAALGEKLSLAQRQIDELAAAENTHRREAEAGSQTSAALRQQLQALELTRKTLESERDLTADRVEQLSKEKAALAERAAKIAQQEAIKAAEQAEQIASLQSQVTALSEELAKQRARATELARQAEHVARLRHELDSATAAKVKATEAARQLREQLAASDGAVHGAAAAETKLVATSRDLQAARQELEQAKIRIAELSDGRQQKLAASDAALRAELGQARAALVQQETVRTELAQRAQVAAAEAAALRTSLTDAQAQLDQQRAQLAEASQRGDGSVESEKREIEEKLAVALRSFIVITEERDELARRLAAAEAQPRPTSAPDQSTELDALRTRLASAEQQAAAAQARIEVLTSSAAASQAEVARLTQLLASRGAVEPAELETLRGRTAAAERTALAAQAELLRLQRTTAARTGAPDTAPVPTTDVQPARPGITTPARVATPAPAITSTTRTHTIAAGDTLSAISRRYYGTANRWNEILAANRDVLRDERSLVAGRTLRIP